MATNEKMLRIGNEEIPESWAAPASYVLTKSDMPYLLIVSDRKDGMLELALFRKTNRDAELVAQRLLPFSVNRMIAGKMTGALIQQIQLRRKMGTGTVQSVLRDFESIFRSSETRLEHFSKLSELLLQENQIRFAAVNEAIEKIVDSCEMDFSMYAPFFRREPAQNTMLHLFNGMFMEWNGLMRLIQLFLMEQTQWTEDPHCDLHIVMCGSLLRLACLAEPNLGNASILQFSPSNGQLLYKMSYEMLKNEKHQYFKLYMTVNAGQYAKTMLEAYAGSTAQKQVQRAAETATIQVFAERMLALPEAAGVYAGYVGGKLLPLNGILLHKDEEGGRLLAAPFSEAFSVLVAEGAVRFQTLDWTKADNGWNITVKYTYNGKQYSLRPKFFGEDQITMVERFPDLVMYKVSGKPEMYLSCCSSEIRAELFGGKKQDGRILLDASDESTYLRLYRNHSEYLGQVDYRIRKKGGGQNG